MLDSELLSHLQRELTQQLATAVELVNVVPQGGGCINQTYRLDSAHDSWFIKLNKRCYKDMFSAEADGLTSLARATAFTIPKVILSGECGNSAYLLMTYLPLSGSVNEQQFARALKQLHNVTNHAYGYHRNNYIGSSNQSNTEHSNWFEFYMQERLEYQLRLLHNRDRAATIRPIWPDFTKACETVFSTHNPKPSLLHGDLWQGNVSQAGTQCCLYDPACYFGDAETDIAMLSLFGKPSNTFYQTYDAQLLEDPNWPLRKACYNLYHVMNHANLFDAGYLDQAKGIIEYLIYAVNS